MSSDMSMHKDEIGIIFTYALAALCCGWLFFSPRALGPSGEVVLTDVQLILSGFTPVILLMSGVLGLILGWAGLTKPRYEKKLVTRQHVIYWSGIAPTLVAVLALIVFGFYVFI